MRAKRLLAVVFVFMLFATETGSPAAVIDDATREVHFRVQLRDVRGKPLQQVPLAIFEGRNAHGEGVTDEAGKVTLDVELPIGIGQIRIGVGFADESSIPGPEQVALVRKMYEWGFDYTSEPCIVELLPDKDVYEVEIVYLDAISVRGIVTGPHDEPIGHSVFGRRAVPADASGRKRFQIRSVRKGAPATLLAVSWSQEVPLAVLLPVHLTAEQTQDDVDLGRIVIPTVRLDSTLDVTLSNIKAISGTRWGVTLVKTDGSVMFGLRADPQPELPRGAVWGNPVQLPAGRYIVTAGNAAMVPSEEQWALLAAIREGRDLEELGLTTITLDPEHPQTVTFDLAELQEQLQTAFELPGAGAHQ